MTSYRRALVATLAAILPALSSGATLAQGFPSKPIRLIVPFAAGSATDTVGRVYAQKMGEILGQPVVVDNRAGANGAIGADQVAKAPADGYTLLAGTKIGRAHV